MEDYTVAPEQEKRNRSKKQMLWFGIASLVMMFAGLTSAYVVSSTRRDWQDIPLPDEFYWSTGVIILSSLLLIVAKKYLRNGDQGRAGVLTFVALVLGTGFVVMQFMGFGTMVSMGNYFTGASSNISASYIYLIVLAHLAHIAAGLIVLVVMSVKLLMKRYTPQKMLGFELGSQFWHFVDILWIYLLLFLLFADDLF